MLAHAALRSGNVQTPCGPVIVTSGGSGERVRDLPDSTEYLLKPWRALDLLIRSERVRGDDAPSWRGDIL